MNKSQAPDNDQNTRQARHSSSQHFKIVCTAWDSWVLLKQKNPKNNHSSLIQPGPAWIIILVVSGIYASLLWAQWSAEMQGGTELSKQNI